MEIQICNNCIVDSGFEAFGTAFGGDEPIACDVCGAEFWSLSVAENKTVPAPNKEPDIQELIDDQIYDYLTDSTYTQDWDDFSDADPGL